MGTIPEQLADQFHTAIQSGDQDTLESILAPDVTFSGPRAEATGSADSVAGLMEMATMITDDQVLVRLTDDMNVLIWSTMETTVASPVHTATWLQLRDDKIVAIRTLFDTRGSSTSAD